jgi:hypothetical protein
VIFPFEGCCQLSNECIFSKLGEDELVFPPLSYFEVVGEPRFQMHAQHRVTVVRIRVNVCAKHLTLEEMICWRKQTVMKIGENFLKEIIFDARLFSKEDFPTTVFDNAVLQSKERDSAWFESDENFKDELDTLVSKRKRTLSKAVKTWEGEGKLKV